MELRGVRQGVEAWAGFATLWVLLSLIWLALTSSFDIQSITAGATISAVLAYVFARRLAIWRTIHAGPSRVYHFLLYTGAFFRELVRANLAVMRYVYAPRIRIQPGIVRAKTRLKSPVGRLALANSVTLTPGSLVLDVDGDDLVVHCLDLTGADPEQVAADAIRPVETHLEKVFG